MRTRTFLNAATAWVAAAGFMPVYGQALMDTGFKYQGQLKQNGQPINGTVDFNFKLYDAALGGTIVAATSAAVVPVSDGLFEVVLDLGASDFMGEDRWLLVGVRYPAGTGSYEFLSPRQPITATPYALHTRGLYCNNAGRLGIGVEDPQAALHVGQIGEYYWDRGDGWGDFSVNNGTLGFSIGVAASGTGTGDVYLWPTGGTERMFLATPTDGQILTIDNDHVGIGTVNPVEKLHVSDGDARFDGDVELRDGSGNLAVRLRPDQAAGTAGEISVFNDAGIETIEILAAEGIGGGQISLHDASGTETIEIDAERGAGGGGYIEIFGGTELPGLYVDNNGSGKTDAALRVHNAQPSQGMAAYLTNNSDFATMHVENAGTGQTLWLVNEGGGDILVARDASRSVFWVDGSGVTHSRVLRIHGGADLSEGFEVRGASPRSAATAHCAPGSAPAPGMVVSIDAEHPGKLVVSSKAYDRKVAGIISGAGDIQPGMLMGQDDSVAGGDHPVALTGRVYSRCVTSNGPIEPGDLLTTSATPGHAMRVTDFDQAQGAIIGKAMTSLRDGQGLVLVLVSLQ